MFVGIVRVLARHSRHHCWCGFGFVFGSVGFGGAIMTEETEVDVEREERTPKWMRKWFEENV